MLMFNLSLNNFISVETLITWLYPTIINNKYYTMMLHERDVRNGLNVVSFILTFMILLKKYEFLGSFMGCARQNYLN